MLIPIGAALMIALVWMPLNFHFQPTNKPLSLVFKGIPTAIALGFALYRCVCVGFAEPFALWMLIGLTLCLLGDIFLEIRFTLGGALFFLGHVSYVLGMRSHNGFTAFTAVVAVCAAAVLLPYLYHFRSKIPAKLMLPLTGYALALSLLLGSALPQPFLALSRPAVLMAVGAALFVASDMTLCRNMLLRKSRRAQYVSLLMYYMGQLLLALSVFPA